MTQQTYSWTDNPTVAGESVCNTDILNECLMHLKYDNGAGKDGFLLFDTKITDRILSGDEAVGWALQGSLVTMAYPDAVNKIKSLYSESYETTYRGITCKKTLDGRYIADISQATEIDKLYVNTGIADFYILDEINEQFYLPKNNWFHQFTTDTEKINAYNAPGIPDHWHYVDDMPNTKDRPRGDDRTNCTTYYETKQTRLASECNPIYGASESVQPPSSNKLLYYKVGDTVINSDSALIDAQELLADGFNQIEDKINTGIESLSNASTALTQTQITNCITEIPQRVNVGINNGILTLKAGSVVIVPYGTSEPALEIGAALNGGEIVDISWDEQKLFYYVKYDEDITTDYSGHTNDNVIVYLQDTGNLIYENVSACYSDSAKPSVSTYNTWYDTTSNTIARYTNTGTLEFQNCSLPICVGSLLEGTGITLIKNIFNGFGFIGSTIWCDKGVKGLVPNGRNADGSLNNIEITNQVITTFARTWSVVEGQTQQISCSASSTDIKADYFYEAYLEQDTFPNKQGHIMLYNRRENKHYFQDNNNSWRECPSIYIGFAQNTSASTIGQMQDLNTYQTFRALDYSSFKNTPHIVETYKNGSSWYRVWSDGWIEQGGLAEIKNTTVNFLKSYTNTNINILLTNKNDSKTEVSVTNVTTNNFTAFRRDTDNGNNLGGWSFWRACGY
ncbi:MAG: hypothetical protein KHX03_06265 [Clostridium sp.]|nr:hypothetical protein [Clostridium sp.]